MKNKRAEKSLNVLAIDVGGSHVKAMVTGRENICKFPSGPAMTAKQMVRKIKRLVQEWKFDVVSIGIPGPVVHGHPVHEPINLGKGWVNFDFHKAFGRPVKIINDAAMQAVGSYQGGRMLFLGLGTGLGSAMIANGILQPMELAHLPYKKGRTYEDYLGAHGLKHLGKKKWSKNVFTVVKTLSKALEADYAVLGGGNAKLLETLPPNTRLGENRNAFLGGFRMWENEHPKDALPISPK